MPCTAQANQIVRMSHEGKIGVEMLCLSVCEECESGWKNEVWCDEICIAVCCLRLCVASLLGLWNVQPWSIASCRWCLCRMCGQHLKGSMLDAYWNPETGGRIVTRSCYAQTWCTYSRCTYHATSCHHMPPSIQRLWGSSKSHCAWWSDVHQVLLRIDRCPGLNGFLKEHFLLQVRSMTYICRWVLNLRKYLFKWFFFVRLKTYGSSWWSCVSLFFRANRGKQIE